MNDQQLVSIVPSDRQMSFQQLEFYAFFHFGINTYTDREWGDGKESLSIFNPTKLDALQWVKTIKASGMKAAILTCKHHDGFCLWPSKYTTHSIISTPYKDGKGDIVKEVSDACKQEGILFGVYLSPWDMNNATYGSGEEYNTYFINQLTELLTNYGDVFCVWLDGACGVGSNGKKQVYDWERYYNTIRTLMPNACISICGEDVRWCGNEAGHTRDREWSVVPAELTKAELTEKKSQQSDNDSFRDKILSSQEMDLGSRSVVKDKEELKWYPAEVDLSIRPGWFYHDNEDDKVRSLERLKDVYLKSVGGNCTLLLNVPPNKDGLIAKPDIDRMKELGDWIKESFHESKKITIVETTTNTVDNEVVIEIHVKNNSKVSYMILMEDIKKSQRIEEFVVEAFVDNTYKTVYEGYTVGYKKIIKLQDIEEGTTNFRIRVTDYRVSVEMKSVELY